MTALGGFLSLDGSAPERRCASVLRAQSRFGRSAVSQSANDHVAIGRDLFPTLPEDRFDRGPVSTARLLLVGDIRIDNRSDVARLAGVPKSDFDTFSDSMLAAALIERRGANGLAAIVGEYALAWWDEAEQTLNLARDMLARRPLLYHRCDRFVAFASMPAGLHALEEIPVAVDPDWLAADLAQLPHQGRSTPHKQIERVLPGHVVTIFRHRFREEQVGNLVVAIDPHLRGQAAEEALRSSVEQAVQAQLRGTTGAVASHLSSGLDSAIVTTTASRLLPGGTIAAYTAAPGSHFAGDTETDWIGDESGLAAQVAATRSNIDHLIVRSDRTSPLAGMSKDFFFQQQPTQNPANAPWGRQVLKEVQARRIGILLSGGGGNFTATYAGIEALPEMLARGSLLEVAKGLRALRRSGRSWPSSVAAAAFPLLPARAWGTASRLWRRPRNWTDYAAIAPQHLAHIEGEAEALGWRQDYPPRRDPVGSRIQALTRTDGAHYYKGALAEFGVSIREPLLDLRVVRTCLAIPPQEYLAGDRPRDLARRTFSDRLPHALLESRGRGLQAADWAHGATAAAVEMQGELDIARRTQAVRDIVDLDQLDRDVKALAETDPAALDPDDLRFEVRLLRGIAATYFARRTEGTN